MASLGVERQAFVERMGYYEHVTACVDDAWFKKLLLALTVYACFEMMFYGYNTSMTF